jgi:hypothetical protein
LENNTIGNCSGAAVTNALENTNRRNFIDFALAASTLGVAMANTNAANAASEASATENKKNQRA